MKKIKIFMFNFMLFIIISIIVLALFSFKKQEKYKPKQTRTQGNDVILIDNYNVDVTYLAKYEITGQVINVHDYTGNSIEDLISPRDVGLCWGFLAEGNYKVDVISAKSRQLNYKIYNKDFWLYINTALGRVNSHISNNHLIPSDKNVNKLINKIQTNDFITIEGYLVNIYAESLRGKTYQWESSLSRNDVGDGACELLYVTNVIWLDK